jgi:hypothetical protein
MLAWKVDWTIRHIQRVTEERFVANERIDIQEIGADGGVWVVFILNN